MKLIAKSSIALLVSSALVACGGTKGSFGLDDVETPKKEITKPISKDVSTTREQAAELDELMKPSYGYSAKIPRRNRIPLPSGQQESNINPNDITRLTNFDEAIPHMKELMADEDARGNPVYTHNESGTLLQQRKGYQYIKTGYIAHPSVLKRERNETGFTHFSQGALGYVYYRGASPASEIPMSSSVTYNGTWDFVSDAKSSRKVPKDFHRQGQPGNSAGALSFNEEVYDGRLTENGRTYKQGHTSEFSVNFNDKTLTGKLYSHTNPHSLTKEQTTHERYNITADIYGNRFRGKATASGHHELFGSSEYLEGGFFGPKAEELAGKFIVPKTAADGSAAYSLFAVFGAKRDKTDDEPTSKLFDAVKINHDFQTGALDNFGDARKLLIDGKEVSLISINDQFTLSQSLGKENDQTIVCCSNLQYSKFGAIHQNKQSSLFLQGERTQTTEMQQQTGSAKYKGTWEGRIDESTLWTTHAGNKEGNSRAEFDVDFARKTIEGKLIAESRIKPAFTLVGEISGSGFTARASTAAEGINLDPNNTNNSKIVHFTNVQVNGGFFGPNAAELGGAFSSNEANKKVGVVFGAKRQVNE